MDTKIDMKYFMPLTKGRPIDGPSTSIFSVPKAQYSPETQAVVRNLMRESRLTFTQKSVFENILRSGKSLPEHPSQLMQSRLQRAYRQQCHQNKARQMGIPLIEQDQHSILNRRNHMRIGTGALGKRTLESIEASGDLLPVTPPRTCIPTSKEAQKDRLAHKMAFGKDQDLSVNKNPKPQVPARRMETVDELKAERFDELIDEIQDRMEFLTSLDQANKGKDYKACIVSQINEKLHEMKKISPEKEKNVRECLDLEMLDKRYSLMFKHRPSLLFDEKM